MTSSTKVKEIKLQRFDYKTRKIQRLIFTATPRKYSNVSVSTLMHLLMCNNDNVPFHVLFYVLFYVLFSYLYFMNLLKFLKTGDNPSPQAAPSKEIQLNRQLAPSMHKSKKEAGSARGTDSSSVAKSAKGTTSSTSVLMTPGA